MFRILFCMYKTIYTIPFITFLLKHARTVKYTLCNTLSYTSKYSINMISCITNANYISDVIYRKISSCLNSCVL